MTAAATPAIDFGAVREIEKKHRAAERANVQDTIAKLASGELTFTADHVAAFLADERMTADELEAAIQKIRRKKELIAILEEEREHHYSLSMRATKIRLECGARDKEREAASKQDSRALGSATGMAAQLMLRASEARMELERNHHGWEIERPDLPRNPPRPPEDESVKILTAEVAERKARAGAIIADFRERGELLNLFPHPLDKPAPKSEAKAEVKPEFAAESSAPDLQQSTSVTNTSTDADGLPPLTPPKTGKAKPK